MSLWNSPPEGGSKDCGLRFLSGNFAQTGSDAADRLVKALAQLPQFEGSFLVDSTTYEESRHYISGCSAAMRSRSGRRRPSRSSSASLPNADGAFPPTVAVTWGRDESAGWGSCLRSAVVCGDLNRSKCLWINDFGRDDTEHRTAKRRYDPHPPSQVEDPLRSEIERWRSGSA